MVDLDALNIRTVGELDRLPWFSKDEQGQLRLRGGIGLPRIIDLHAHVGWSFGIAPRIDMAACPPLIHMFDYDVDQEFLLDEVHPTKDEMSVQTREWLLTFLTRTRLSRTHTAANLLAHIERFNYEHVCLMPLELPFHARHAFETLAASKMDPRLIAFAAVGPRRWGARKESILRTLLDDGARGMKFHPEFQFTAPDHPDAMRLFEWCEAHDVLVLSHCGYGGSEPAWMRRNSELERFRPMLEAFPKLRVVLGHTGLSQWQKALPLAKQFAEHVWLDVSGQHAGVIREILGAYDRARIVFGSDWPYYPLPVALARVLVATEDRPDWRADILHDNAARLLGCSTCATQPLRETQGGS